MERGLTYLACFYGFVQVSSPCGRNRALLWTVYSARERFGTHPSPLAIDYNIKNYGSLGKRATTFSKQGNFLYFSLCFRLLYDFEELVRLGVKFIVDVFGARMLRLDEPFIFSPLAAPNFFFEVRLPIFIKIDMTASELIKRFNRPAMRIQVGTYRRPPPALLSLFTSHRTTNHLSCTPLFQFCHR